jgi:hypothetical protein
VKALEKEQNDKKNMTVKLPTFNDAHLDIEMNSDDEVDTSKKMPRQASMPEF